MQRFLPILLTAAAALAACVRAPAPADARVLVLRGVAVIDGTGAPPLHARDVIIAGDRIAAVRPAGGPVPAGATILDLPGRYVIPGLIDTHAHVTILLPDAARGERVYRRNVSERVLRLLLDFGITTVRNPAAPTHAGVELRADVARGAVAGPRIVTSGDLINDRLDDAALRGIVREQVAAGVDFIKVYAGLEPEHVRVVIDEARAAGVPVVGHLQRTTWTEAARLGIDGITHGVSWSRGYLPPPQRDAYRETMKGRLDWLDWLDPDSDVIEEMIRELAQRRIPVDPTLITYHTKFFGDQPRWTQHPQLQRVPELAAHWRGGATFVADWSAADFQRARALYPKLESLVRRYHEAGMLLTTGSDLPQAWTIPGVSLHEELELLVAAGIPAPAVLQMATRNGAEALGLLGEIGTVEAGKVADLVVLRADPQTDIRNTRSIELVVQGGRVVSHSHR